MNDISRGLTSTVDVTLELKIFDQQQTLLKSFPLGSSLVLGRQHGNEDGPFAMRREGPQHELRVVVAGIQEFDVSRRHLRIEPLSLERIRLTNLSAKQPVILLDEKEMLGTGRSLDLVVPVRFQLGSRILAVESSIPLDAGELRTLAGVTLAPGAFVPAPGRLTSATLSALPENEVEQLLQSLQNVLHLMQSTAASGDFYRRAAQTAAQLIELHSAQVLLREGADWRAAGTYVADPEESEDVPPSRYVLDRVCGERRTFWRVHLPTQTRSTSLVGIESVVAAPILHRNGTVAGVLYGDRQQSSLPRPITRLEALLMELLACNIAAEMARMEQEQEAIAARVRFEQFFTPELARQLTAQPELLDGRDEEISTLFIDLCGFSRISERVGSAKSADWIADVMNVVSDAILDRHGVLVDFVGDGVLAMWGAPQKEPHHAELACGAALAVLELEPVLTARWRAVLGEAVRFNMGLNTGMARVGNVGSRKKFKYGPLGNTVNLASRIQGAAKHFKTNLLIAGATRRGLDDTLQPRRLGKVRVKDIAEPVELYELATADRPGWEALKAGYESALDQFERGEFRSSSRILGSLLVDHPQDGPSLVLLARVVNAMVEEADHFDPVWILPSK